jgi:hypothetical protein
MGRTVAAIETPSPFTVGRQNIMLRGTGDPPAEEFGCDLQLAQVGKPLAGDGQGGCAFAEAPSSDRGKEGTVQLDWDDSELFQEIVRTRIEASTELAGSFEEVWGGIAEPTIGVESSFGYIVDRTLMRPGTSFSSSNGPNR